MKKKLTRAERRRKNRKQARHKRRYGNVSTKICKFCGGENIGVKEQVFKDGTRHNAYRCLDCDKHIKFSKKSRSNKQVYQKRAAILKDLGYDTYKDYLDSNLWSEIRNKTLTRDNNKCVFCKEKAYAAHHSDYTRKNLSGDDIKTVLSVCKECHYNLHFTKDGKERKLDQVIRLVKKCIKRGSTVDFRLCTICHRDMKCKKNELGYQKRCKNCNKKHKEEQARIYFKYS